MKIIITLIIILSFNFFFIKHPLSIGLILFFQTILSCLICRFYLSSYLFSYILFLIFIGGILILFIYISRIASNEKFFFSFKLIILDFLFLILINIFDIIDLKILNIKNNIIIYINHDRFIIIKLYIIPSGIIILILTIFLLFVLIVVINILTINISTLRRRVR